MIDEFYSPADIHFTREQMIWLITWLTLLEEGKWPKNPKETGYTETPRVQTSRSHRAPFQTPAEYFSEVTARLKSTRDAGEVLVHEVQHGLDAYELLSPVAKRALNYCSGWRRRQSSFSQWCYDQARKSENNRI